MHLLSHAVHSDALTPFPTTGLPDDPRLEADLADDRRAAIESVAGAFDPLGLYAAEVERDDATAYLADNLPADASIRLARHHVTQRVAGAWETVEGWVATATTADSGFTLSRQATRPLVAAEELLNAWRAFGPGDDGARATSAAAVAVDRPRAA